MASANGHPNDHEKLAFLDGGPITVEKKSKWQILLDGFNANPDGAAVEALHQPPNHLQELFEADNEPSKDSSAELRSHLSWTYRQIHFAAQRLAGSLYSQGIRPGMVIVTLVPNSIEYALCYWAAARLGCTFSSLDTAYVSRPAELEDVINVVDPRVIVVPSSDMANVIDGIAQKLHVKLILAEETDETPAGWNHFAKFILQHSGPAFTVGVTEDEVNAIEEWPTDIVFTSGTTGRPKACACTPRALSFQVPELVYATRTTIGDKILAYTANFRVICRVSIMTAWSQGATVIFPPPNFDARTLLKVIIEQRCTHTVVVPALIHALARHPDLVALLEKDSPLKNVNVGGDMVNTTIIDKVHNTLHPEWVMPTFGMSEGSCHFSWIDGDVGIRGVAIPTTAGSIVSVGKIRPGCKVRVCEPGTRAPVKRGEIGALHVSGPATIRHYLENRDPESFYVDHAGHWFMTGDQAMIDESGAVFVLGRSKDIIKRKGVGLSPAVIENCLNRLLEVDSCIVGYPHAEYGEVPVAVIRSKEASGKALKQTVKERSLKELGDDSQIEDVLTFGDLQITEFPMNSTGKVVKRDVRALIENYYGGPLQ